MLWLLAPAYLWLLYAKFGGPVMLMVHALEHRDLEGSADRCSLLGTDPSNSAAFATAMRLCQKLLPFEVRENDKAR
mgnify:CR=1 FL=1